MDFLDSLQTVHTRHTQVHEDDIGLQLLGELNRDRSIARLADDFKVLFGFENEAQTVAHNFVIVGDQYSDHRIPFNHFSICHCEEGVLPDEAIPSQQETASLPSGLAVTYYSGSLRFSVVPSPGLL